MNLLLRQVRIFDPSSPFHQLQTDIQVRHGVIASIGKDLPGEADILVDKHGLTVSPGWLDIFSHFPDPGFEYKESLETGAEAAAAGGFTDVMVLPNSAPVLHNKSAVEYIVQRSKTLPANLHPIGAVTKNTEGKELSEMYDMHQSGAVAFGDGNNTIQSSGILLKALQYLKAIDKVLIQLPDDKAISATGLMNEGIASTRLGLPGKPAIAEELMIARDIELARYTDSKIHFTAVSTAASIQLIARAKSEGVKVSCSVTPYHLLFCDEDLLDYDTNLKVNPPLRTKADRESLRAAVLDGSVDCIASHHAPHEKDSKVVEFEYARYGMISLQTAFAVVKTCLPSISTERILQLFCLGPRELFDLPAPSITEGAPACMSVFAENESWQFTQEQNRSRSANSPLFGQSFTCRPYGIINKDQVFLNE
jgi:dihydroorotase